MPLSSREVEQKGRDLTKAASQAASSSSVLALIGDLRTGVVATEDLLRSTKIGVTVGKLRAHNDKTIARAATELVSKWRSDVGKGRGNAPGSGASTPKVQGEGKAGASSAARNGASPAPGKSTAASPSVKPEKVALKVPKEKRNAKEDGVKWQVTDNQTRDSCIKLMYDGLAFMSEEAPDTIIKVARSVETAAYTAFPDASSAYRDKMRSLFQNLKNKQNQSLRDGVLDGSIPPTRFVKMTHEELKSAERRAEDEKLIKENLKDAMVARDMKAISTQLQCGKCGQKKVSYTQAQTRSADEPMTTFCECLHCGNRWKFS